MTTALLISRSSTLGSITGVHAERLPGGQAIAPERAGLRVMLAALCCQKGDWEANLAAHCEVLASAREAGCHLAVFPEMSLSGSAAPPGAPGTRRPPRARP